jgi:hypothetical protein
VVVGCAEAAVDVVVDDRGQPAAEFTNQLAATVAPRTSGERDPAGAEAGHDGTREWHAHSVALFLSSRGSLD